MKKFKTFPKSSNLKAEASGVAYERVGCVLTLSDLLAEQTEELVKELECEINEEEFVVNY